MTNVIKHRGTVEMVQGSHIQVRILQTSACSSCSAKGHCNAAESKEKLIDIHDAAASTYQVGQSVMVVGATSMGIQAVWLAFGIPFLLLVVTLFLAMHFTEGNEALSALSALAVLAPYYLVVFLLKNRLAKQFQFTIKPIEYQ
ncbi:MAG: SoxR reducing system RseC family protein [Phocaeicola sp.]